MTVEVRGRATLLHPLPVSWLLVGVFDLAVAAWLRSLGRDALPNRAFVLVLALTGAFNIASGLGVLANLNGRPGAAVAFTYLLPLLLAAASAATVRFLAVYPRPRRRWGGRQGAVAVAAVLALFALAYVAVPGAYWRLAIVGGVARVVDTGPLYAANLVLVPFNLILGFALFRKHAVAPPGPLRRSLYVVALGWAIPGAYQLSQAVDVLLNRFGIANRTLPVDGWARVVDPLAVLVAAALFAGVLRALESARSADPAEAWRVERARRILLAALGAGLLAALVTMLAPAWGFLLEAYVGSLALAAMPLLVAYAILRHQLFDIDLKAKWAVEKGTMLTIAGLVFVLVTPAAENVLGATYGQLVGGLLGGLVGFATAPFRAMAELMARRLFPGVENSPAYRSRRKAEVYKQAVRLALSDGALSRDEDRHLHELAAELGLSPVAEFDLREEVERERAPPEGARDSGAPT